MKKIAFALFFVILSFMSSQELNAGPWRKELFSVLIKVGAEVAGVVRGLIDDYFSEDEREEQQTNIWRLQNQIKIQAEQGPSSEIDLDALKSTVNYIDRQFQKPADLIDRDKLIDELDNCQAILYTFYKIFIKSLNPQCYKAHSQ